MSRTRRKLPFSLFWDTYFKAWRKWPVHYFRPIKTLSAKKSEQAAVQALREEGFNPRPRVQARGNKKGTIPDSWDDIHISARRELDYNKNQNSKVKDNKWP